MAQFSKLVNQAFEYWENNKLVGLIRNYDDMTRYTMRHVVHSSCALSNVIVKKKRNKKLEKKIPNI